MKILVLATALIAAVAFAAPAEAAKKGKRVVAKQQATLVSNDSYVVREADGEVLGADPDPFIRMMLRKDGSLRHQSGR